MKNFKTFEVYSPSRFKENTKKLQLTYDQLYNDDESA